MYLSSWKAFKFNVIVGSYQSVCVCVCADFLASYYQVIWQRVSGCRSEASSLETKINDGGCKDSREYLGPGLPGRFWSVETASCDVTLVTFIWKKGNEFLSL